jgi:hypothetical protein
LIENTDSDQNNNMSEEEIDKTIEGSFPASDPPSWTLGTDHGRSNIGLTEDSQDAEEQPIDRRDDSYE